MIRRKPTYEELVLENENLKKLLSDQKEKENSELEIENVYKAIARNTADNLFVQDLDLRYRLIVNPQLGWEEQEIIGKTDFDYSNSEDAEKLIRLKKQVIETGESINVVIPLLSRTGEMEYFDGVYLPKYDAGGKIDGIIGFFRNVTESTRSEKEFNLFFDLVPNMVVVASSDGYFKKLNKIWESVLGYTIEELKARPFVEFIHPDDVVSTLKEVEKQQDKHSTLNFLNRYRCKNGQYKWLDWVAIPSPDGKNLYAAARDITEQKRAEQALKDSEELFSTTFHSSPIPVSITDLTTGKWVEVNQAFLNVTGYLREEIIGRTFQDIHLWKNIENRENMHRILKEQGHVVNYEVEINKKSGGGGTMLISVEKIELTGNPFLLIMGIEITDRKQVEEDFRVREEKYRLIFENVQDVYYEVSMEGNILEISPSIVLFSEGQLNRNDLIGKPIMEFYVDQDSRNSFLSKIMQHKTVSDYELSFRNLDGTIKHSSISAKIVFDKQGKPVKIVGSSSDITNRKIAEREILASKAKLDVALASMTDAVFISDTEGRFIEFNDAFATFHKFRNKEECAKTLAEYPDFLEVYLDSGKLATLDQWAVPSALSGKTSTNSVYRLRRKDTGENWFGSYSYAPIRNEKNEIVGSVVTARDITLQKQMEDAIVSSERELRLLAEAMPQIVWITRADGWNTYFNQQWVDYTGLTLEESYGHRWITLIHSDDKEFAREAWDNAVSNNGTYSIECRLRRKDGMYRWWLIRGVPVFGIDGKISKWFGTCTDIHQIKLTENELVLAKIRAEENNRLKSALLANMSHEIRTPMNAIIGFSNLLSDANEEEKNSYAIIIQKSSNHLLKLLDDVILLSRLQSEKLPVGIFEFKPLEVIKEVYQMFNHPELNKGLEIIQNYPLELKNLVVKSDEDKIRQVLTNLVSNAIKYTFKGYVEIGFVLLGNLLEFYVKDTGIGIQKDEQQKIFESFYRGEQALANAIRGNGLGLNIARELIGLLGGNMAVESEPDRGSRFSFTIPCILCEQNKQFEPSVQLPPKLSGELMVLIAEDEPFNYQFLEILLKKKVKRVDHAINGKVAVEMTLKNGYDLILMDMKMPVMDGFEATRILRGKFPDLKIIAQTAFTLPEEKDLVYEAGCDDIIQKPIKKEALMEMIYKYSI